MPLCPQITNTPIVLPREVAITAVTFTSTTAIYTASGHSFTAGDVVVTTGLAPAGYNGTFTISSVSGSTTFTVPNTTNATVTDQSGLATPGGDYVISAVIPVIAATTTQVNVAQTNASAALAAANTAYTTAVNSLQPSAYAIQNPTTKQLTSIDATGLTVYSGASATSGARVVLNSVGLAGYDSGGTASFSISASTGAAVFRGNITTGATITGGTMNIGGNAIIDSSGFLTATGATVTGAINATSGYIGSAANGWNFSTSGFLTNSGGSTILYPTTTPGGNASTYSIYTDRGVYAERIYSTGTQASSIFSLGGLSVNGQVSGAAGSFVVNSSGNMTTVGSISASGAVSTSNNISTTGTGTITAAGQLNGNAEIYASQAVTSSVTAATNCFITSGGLIRKTSTTSSARYKENITDLSDVEQLDPKALLNLPVRAFTYKKGHISNQDDRNNQMLPGFIAEEVDAIYPIAADYDNGVETWNSFYIIPAMLYLIQDLYKEIDKLKGE